MRGKTTPELACLPKQPRNRPHAARQAKHPPEVTGTGGGSQQRVNRRSNAAGLIERAPYQRCCNGGMRRSDNRLRPQAALRLRAGVLGVGRPRRSGAVGASVEHGASSTHANSQIDKGKVEAGVEHVCRQPKHD